MILLSNSLPKTGSTLIANYQEDILKKIEIRNGQAIIKTNYGGRYIDYPTKKRLLNLLALDLAKGSFIIKCHWMYSNILNYYCALPNVKMTYSYRDPRDIILSMIDHGNRTRAGKDLSGAFKDCYNVIELIPNTINLMEQLKVWKSKKKIYVIKYEDFMCNPYSVLKDMLGYLNWNLNDDTLKELILEKEQLKTKSHNFNKGTTQRWREEMTPEEQEACLKAFQPYLEWLNYDLY